MRESETPDSREATFATDSEVSRTITGEAKDPKWVSIPASASSILSILAGVAIVGLMLITVIDVVLRKFFSSGFPGAIEINEIALVVVVFLAMMSAEMYSVHVRTPILTERVGARAANILHIVGLTPAVVFLTWMTIRTGQEAVKSLASGEFRFGIVNIPLWPGKVAVAIGIAGLTIAIAIKLALALRNLVKGRAAAISAHESVF